MKKIIGITFVSIGALLMIALVIGLKKNPDVNRDHSLGIAQSIYKSPHKLVQLSSGGTIFKINYVKNAPKNAINPHFPAIHLLGKGEFDAWLHIVHTDAQEPALKVFVDAHRDGDHAHYPFYAKGKNFYNAPYWRYSLLNKPLSFWRGHAYAVAVDQEEKKITFKGGVAWGFDLPRFSFSPVACVPQALSVDDWKRDMGEVSGALAGYEISA